jgi:hypothetical protein
MNAQRQRDEKKRRERKKTINSIDPLSIFYVSLGQSEANFEMLVMERSDEISFNFDSNRAKIRQLGNIICSDSQLFIHIPEFLLALLSPGLSLTRVFDGVEVLFDL